MSDQQLIKLLAAMNNNSFPWIELSAAVIALCALVVSIYFGFLQRKHHILSSKPLVNLHFDLGIDFFSIRLENEGLGPAMIEPITYVLDEKGNQKKHSKVTDFLHEFRGRMGLMDNPNFEYYTFEFDKFDLVLGAGKTVQLCRFNIGQETLDKIGSQEFRDSVLRVRNQADILGFFKDIYGNRYLIY